jgi:hypothetical protein
MRRPDTPKHVLADTRCNWLGIELDQPEQHTVKGVGSQLRQLDQNLAKVGGFAKRGDQFVLDSVAPNVKESGNQRALHINPGLAIVLGSVAPNVKESGNQRALHINTRADHVDARDQLGEGREQVRCLRVPSIRRL